MTAEECRELAKSYRENAYRVDAPRKASLLRNIAHSLSSQLEALARDEPPPVQE